MSQVNAVQEIEFPFNVSRRTKVYDSFHLVSRDTCLDCELISSSSAHVVGSRNENCVIV